MIVNSSEISQAHQMTKKLPTINIKGKEYVMVKDRIVAFNELYPNGYITTLIIKNDLESVVCKSEVIPDASAPSRFFTGHSEAYREGNMGSVPVEVAETSAVGRALAMLGIGIIESVASADEVTKSNFAPSKGAPMTEKQSAFIHRLWTQKGVKPVSLEGKSSFDARGYIDRLMSLPDAVSVPSTPTTPDDYLEMTDEQRAMMGEENRANGRKRYASRKVSDELPIIEAEPSFDAKASAHLDAIARE